MSGPFEGKTAIVTGASRGIGLGIAERLVADGARVVITARKKDALDEAVQHLGGAAHALGVPGKADDPVHQDDTVRPTLEAFGSIDFLVKNTGINPTYGPMVDIDLDCAGRTPGSTNLTLERLGVPAARSVFIDDAEPNVDGARAFGLNAVLHVDPASTRSALAKLVPALSVPIGVHR